MSNRVIEVAFSIDLVYITIKHGGYRTVRKITSARVCKSWLHLDI